MTRLHHLSVEMALLRVLASSSGEPLGARKAASGLNALGFDSSEATVSRILRNVDKHGFTKPLGAKGRVLTAKGMSAVAALEVQRRREAVFQGAINVKSVQEVLDLLIARRAVERETARATASRANDDESDSLARLVGEHETALANGIPARDVTLGFHRYLGVVCGNKTLGGLSQVVFDPQLDDIEDVLDLITRAHESGDQSLPEHRRIARAIAARDPVRAEREMVAHFDRLISDVHEFMSSGRVGILERMLARAPAILTDADSN